MDNPKNIRSEDNYRDHNPMSKESRSAFVIALLTIVISSLGLAHTSFQALNGNSPLLLILVGSMVFSLLLGAVAAFLSRRGNSTQAGWILILAVSQTILVRAWILSTDFEVISIAGMMIILYIGIRVLPQNQIQWATFTGILVLVFSRLISSYLPALKVDIIAFDRATQILAWFLLILIGGLLVKEFRLLSMTNKLVVAFLLVALVVTYTTNFFNSARTEQALTERVGYSLSGLASSQAQAVGDVLNNEIESLTTLSFGSMMRRALNSANRTYVSNPEIVARKIDFYDKSWSELVSENQLSDELIRSHLENEPAVEMKKFTGVSPFNVQLILADKYGGLVAATSHNTDYYQGDEYWFNAAYDEGDGKPFISSPVFDPSLQESVIYFAVPVNDESGTTIGVLQATYLLDGIADIFATLKAGESGTVHLHIPSKAGFPQYPRIPTRVMKDGKLFTADMPSVEKIAGMSSQVYGELTYDGSPSFFSWANIRPVRSNPMVENLGWWLLVYQDKAEILAPVTEQIRQAGFLSSMIVGVVAALAVLLSQYLAGPIVRLTKTAEEIRAGDLTARANVETEDEVGKLATSFNEMTGQLRRTLQDLESRVKERTRELSLAGNVGRELSQERSLDHLLSTAVEMIQENFDLYYTQLYLLDATGKNLILRAGSGKVGQELLRRAHRLPVGGGSINGLAAFQNQAIIVSETKSSPIFRSNPLLPDTRSEISVPLSVGDRVVGVLDMQSSLDGHFTEENLPAFEALAGQLAVAIENADLFNQAQMAREELESHSRRYAYQGWQEFLNAVERKERIGFEYNHDQINVLDDPLKSIPDSDFLSASIEVVGEPVGSIQLEKGTDQQWAEEDRILVNNVASQIARHIDNLRLLAQTEKFRQQAVESARRLTRSGWDEYLDLLEKQDVELAYDHVEVAQVRTGSECADVSRFSRAIEVRGETIGELAVEGADHLDDDSIQLIQIISERLADHVENLRLSAQTEKSLQETESLYAIISRLNAARSYDEILNALLDNTILNQADQMVMLGVFDQALGDGKNPKWIYPVAYHSDSDPKLDKSYPFSNFDGSSELLFSAKPIIYKDLRSDELCDQMPNVLISEDSPAKSSMIVPLALGENVIGFVQAYFKTHVTYSDAEIQYLMAVAGQASIAVQSLLLLEKAQARARQEQRIREVTTQVFSAADIDSILRKTVEQVGRVLGSSASIYISQNRKSESQN
jgi:GAF domain-containing protein/HAMP domain-containing protein